MSQEQTGLGGFIDRQRSRLVSFLRTLERNFSPQHPLVAVIRREGVISQGRYVMYFEVTLFGDNPVVLEEFGHVMNRETTPSPAFRRELAEAIQNYRYYIEIRQRFQSVEDARDFWVARGATAFWQE